MSLAADLLSRYALRHRDPRNIAGHFIGVPLALFGLGVLLSRPTVTLGGWLVSPAFVLAAGLLPWYWRCGEVFLGVATSAAVAALLLAGQHAAGGGVVHWLGWGIGTLIAGRLLQVAGHWYEGRKPQGVGEVETFLVAPMFLTAEVLFASGWNRALQAQIEHCAGPVRLRDLARIA